MAVTKRKQGITKRAERSEDVPDAGRHGREARECVTHEERLTYIEDMMAMAQWNNAQSVVLMKEWGVSRGTVSRLAAEASRMIRRTVSRDPILRATIMNGCEILFTGIVSNQDPRAIAAAPKLAEILDDMSGMRAQRRRQELLDEMRAKAELEAEMAKAKPKEEESSKVVRFIVETVSSERPKPDPEPTE